MHTKVMIVEDETIVGLDMKNTLVQLGYEVTGISHSGEKAINDAIKNKPDIILMDIQLDGQMTGIDTAKRIKQRFDVPIIYLTSYSDDTTLKEALSTTPSGYLLKPFIPRELHTSIQAALHLKSKDNDTKLARLKYIQSNILKNKDLQNQIKDIRKDPNLTHENKLERLLFIKELIRKKRKFEKKFEDLSYIHSSIENLIEDNLFTLEVNIDYPLIFPIKELAYQLNYTEDEIIRMGSLSIPLLIHPVDIESMEKFQDRIIANPSIPVEVEIRIKNKSDHYRCFYVRGIFEKKSNTFGKILYLTRDITWMKSLQSDSHTAREKLVAISNNPYFGVAVLDKNAKFLNVNSTIENLTGYTKEDLNWLHFSDFIGAKHLVSICENFERLKNGKLDIYQAEVLIHTAHQGVVWVYIVLNAIRDPEKNVEKILCTLVDISESKLFSKPKYI